VAATIIAERLLDLLMASPHLIPYVRELEVNHGDFRVVQFVAQVPWSSVDQLTLGLMDPGTGDVILDKVAGLVGLSSLHSLVFRLGR
jgi:hypothetical protein